MSNIFLVVVLFLMQLVCKVPNIDLVLYKSHLSVRYIDTQYHHCCNYCQYNYYLCNSCSCHYYHYGLFCTIRSLSNVNWFFFLQHLPIEGQTVIYERVQSIGLTSLSCNWVNLNNEKYQMQVKIRLDPTGKVLWYKNLSKNNILPKKKIVYMYWKNGDF